MDYIIYCIQRSFSWQSRLLLLYLLLSQVTTSLEPELLEEVVGTSSLLLTGSRLLVQVLVLEDLLQGLLHISLLVTNKISLIDSLLQVHINLVTSGEDVTNIDVLNERLHGTAPLLNLLLGHTAGDLTWSTGNTGNKAVGETLVVISVLNVLDDNGLLTGVTASKDDDNFSRFDDGHFDIYILLVVCRAHKRVNETEIEKG